MMLMIDDATKAPLMVVFVGVVALALHTPSPLLRLHS
jgi:hypothetical protein